MAIIKVPWTSQPQTVVPLNPLYLANVISVWKPFAGPIGIEVGGSTYSAARTDVLGKYGLHGYLINGSSEFLLAVSSVGLVLDNDQSKADRQMLNTSIPHASLVTSNFTFVIQFQLRSVTGVQYLFGGFNTTQSPIWLYGVGLILDGTILRAVCANGNSAQHVASSVTMEIGKVYTVVFTRVGTALKVFVNGVKDSGTGTSGAQTYNFGWLATGNPGASNLATCNGWTSVSGVWLRAFADVEAYAICTNPWQLFAPQRRTIFAPGAAAVGGSTITTATLPAGVGYMGSGQTRAIQPAGLSYMG